MSTWAVATTSASGSLSEGPKRARSPAADAPIAREAGSTLAGNPSMNPANVSIECGPLRDGVTGASVYADTGRTISSCRSRAAATADRAAAWWASLPSRMAITTPESRTVSPIRCGGARTRPAGRGRSGCPHSVRVGSSRASGRFHHSRGPRPAADRPPAGDDGLVVTAFTCGLLRRILDPRPSTDRARRGLAGVAPQANRPHPPGHSRSSKCRRACNRASPASHAAQPTGVASREAVHRLRRCDEPAGQSLHRATRQSNRSRHNALYSAVGVTRFRCWPWPPGPATCSWPASARAAPTRLAAPPTS